MRHRTKNHLLKEEEIISFLKDAKVGRIGTLNSNGYPYILPMHFVYSEDKIYLHGLPKGQKIDNIKRDSKVSFEIDEMFSLIEEGIEKPCDVNTEFKSVILYGKSSIVNDITEKTAALKHIVAKYTPKLSNKELPQNMITSTAVIKIEIGFITGRYYK